MGKFISIVAIAAVSVANRAPAPAPQDEWNVPQPAWEGVWQGTVGGSLVHVCLDKTPYDSKGAYYYDRVKRLLRLAPGRVDGEWFEQQADDADGPRWRIKETSGAISGTWSDGKKVLPVRLTRIAGPSREFEGPCGSNAFMAPRIAGFKLRLLRRTVDGTRYTRWTFTPGAWFEDVSISTFTLDRPGAAVAKVNALLRAALPGSDGRGEWLDCVAGNVNASGADGSFSTSIEPTLLTRRWLAARETGEYYCGGAHPENTNLLRTFDLASGTEVDPLDWLGARAVTSDGELKTLTPAFRAALLKGWKAQAQECDEAIRSQDHWRAGLARGALMLTPSFPRVIMACEEDFRIPFAKLQPWLNDRGKAALGTLPD